MLKMLYLAGSNKQVMERMRQIVLSHPGMTVLQYLQVTEQEFDIGGAI